MTKKRKMLCWLLLLAILYAECFTMAIGQTYARYDTTVTANTIIESRPYGMTSDCMVKAGEPSLTVLAGTLDKEKDVSFWLKSNGSDAVGELLWSVSNPEHLQYVQISMKIDDTVIEPGEKIDLLRDIPMAFTLTIAPTAIAQTAEHEEVKIHVVVTWGNEMWGTFQVILPEVIKEEKPEEDPENIVPENGNENTEPEEDPESAIPESGEQNTASEDETNTQESPAVFSMQEENAENDPAPIEENTIHMETLSRFNPSQALPVKIQVGSDITSVRLGLQKTVEEQTEFKPFPDYTMFSLNNGQSYYMLYDGQSTEIVLQDTTSIPVLLDFSRTDLEEDDTFVLAMEAYSGENLKKTCTAEVKPNARESCLALVHPVDSETKAVQYTLGDTRESAAKAREFGWPSRTISKDTALEITLPMEWLNAEVEYSVEFLTMTEAQTLSYIPVILSATGLQGKYVDYDLTHNFVFQIGENPPQAGTYRLTMKWSFEDICFAKTQTTFFINYSA